MSVSSSVLNSSLDSTGSSLSVNSSNGDSPKNRSTPFSISAILSDEVGGQKWSSRKVSSSMPSKEKCAMNVSSYEQRRGPLETPKRPKVVNGSREGACKRSHIALSETANLISPTNSSTNQMNPSYPVTMMGGATPPLHPTRQNNSSVTLSPFDPSFLQRLGQQTSPTAKDDLLSDSLDMLSAVALYHGELSSTLGTPVQNRLADIKITSSCDGSSDRSEDWNGVDSRSNISHATHNKSRTPCILKRRHRTTSIESVSNSCGSGDESAADRQPRPNLSYLNAGFLSPLSDDKSLQNGYQSGFSPSIFLSRPDQSTSHSHPHNESFEGSEAVKVVVGDSVMMNQSQVSDTESAQNQPLEVAGNFATSTPIKSDKENLSRSGLLNTSVSRHNGRWSPNILRTGRRQLLKEANDCISGSDSEPVKRPMSSPHSPPQKRCKKSKACTKLSPLLENACSPIEKGDHTYQPSPLTRALSTTPTRPQAPPAIPPITSIVGTTVSSVTSLSHAADHPIQPVYLPEGYLPNSMLNNAMSTIGMNSQVCTPNLQTGTVMQHVNTNSSNHYLFPASSLSQTFSLPQAQPQAMIPHIVQSPQPGALYPMTSLQNTSKFFGPSYAYHMNPPIYLPGQQPGIDAPQYMPGAFCINPRNNLPGNGGFVHLQVMPDHQQSLCAVGNTHYAAPSLSSAFVPLTNYGSQGSSFLSYQSNTHVPDSLFAKNDSKIKSVPPWFIFPNNRPEGKRNRLTEAINKSISETPSQSIKLPVEWSKYACGQTNDQKELTDTARSFLQCQPRTLNFDEDTS